MNKTEAIANLEKTFKSMHDGYQTHLEHGGKQDVAMEEDIEATSLAIASMKKLMEYEKLERTGKLIRMPDCRRCKHAYRDDTRCYECLANMTCWPNNFEPRKKVKK